VYAYRCTARPEDNPNFKKDQITETQNALMVQRVIHS